MRTVLFNKSYSGTIGTLRFLKETHGASVRLVALHEEPTHPFSAYAHLDAEPKEKSPEVYARAVLALAKKHEAQTVVPTHRAVDLAQYDSLFREAGIDLLLVATYDTLCRIEDKSRFYDGTGEVPGLLQPPPYRKVSTLEEAVAAARWVEAQGDTPCIKPAKGVYGFGFRVLTPEVVDELESLSLRTQAPLGAQVIPPVVDAWKAGLRILPPETPQPLDSVWLVMTTCTGAERSIDCLAWHGELLGCVIRKKSPTGRGQLIEENPQLVAQVSEMVRHWGLHSAFNIQTLEHRGQNTLLEINARLSGGSLMASLSGLDVGGWAVLLSLGLATPSEVPTPRTGLTVALGDTGLLLPEPVVDREVLGGVLR